MWPVSCFSWRRTVCTWSREVAVWSANGHIVDRLFLNTTVDMPTPHCDANLMDDGLAAQRAYRCSLVLFTTRLRSSAFSKHVHKSDKTLADVTVSTWIYGAYTELLLMLLEMAAASHNAATVESERMFRWVKSGLLKESLTPSRLLLHFLLVKSHQIWIYSEFPVRFHWPTKGECCQLEDLK